MPVNLEIKCPLPDLESGHAAARRLGAREAGILRQKDTYYAVSRGRLKLRAIEGAPAELIFYDRDESTGRRECHYVIYRTVRPAELDAVLAAAHGIRSVVEKTRYLYRFRNARIHLDEVARLGSFLEFEIVVAREDAELAGARALLDELVAAFGLDETAFLEGSYVDLLERAG